MGLTRNLLFSLGFIFSGSVFAYESRTITVCKKLDPRYKIVSTVEVTRSKNQAGSEVLRLSSELEIDGKKIQALQKVCARSCAHGDGNTVIELRPRLDPKTDAVEKLDLLLWSGANVNRFSLTECRAK